MDSKFLQKNIKTLQENLIHLADQKENPLKDPEVYQKSCELDYWVVEYTKLRRTSEK